jgi:hypothetical protein
MLMLHRFENREYGRRDPPSWPRGSLYPQKSALILLTSGGRSVGIVRSRTQATEFSLYVYVNSLSCLKWECAVWTNPDKDKVWRRKCSRKQNVSKKLKKER